MLILQVRKLSSQRSLIVQKTNGHVKTAKNALSVGLELG
jgi:hypothetical protein